MSWKIAFALFAIGILAAGCAGRGGEAQAGGGATSAPAGSGDAASAGQSASGDGIGDLFQIGAGEPLEGSGYDVPAAGEE